MMKRLILVPTLLGLVVLPPAFLRADSTPPASQPTTKPLSNMIGVDFSSITPNADGTITCTFHWKDKDGTELTRSATITKDTVIGIDGEVKTLADVNQSIIHKKAVATVGEDGVTAIMLRVGRKKIAATPDVIARATPKPTTKSIEALAKSDALLDQRVDKIVSDQNLTDSTKASHVRQALVTDLKTVRDAHNLGFAPAPSVHTDFINALNADLSPEQVEKVKDLLTINKVPITFKAYHEIIPDLKPEDDAKILEILKLAREESLDVKAIEEVDAIFKERKGQIQKYLDEHGYDWEGHYNDFVKKQKAGATQPAN